MSLSEYVDDMQKSDDTGGTSVAGNNGNTGSEPVINPEREKTKWEDTITNRSAS